MYATQLVLSGPDGQTDAGRPAMWDAVDGLVDRAPSVDDLRAHGLELLAVRRLRQVGRPVPEDLVEAERLAAVLTLATTVALERVREAYDGTIMLFKGLEIASRYPDRRLRPLRDVDLLVDRPEDAHGALVAAGFEPVGYEDGYYADRHHLRPLRLPDLPGLVEIHRRLEWVSWGDQPLPKELFAAAVPSRTGIDGVLAPSPAHHALLVAVHSWAAVPLRRILDLVDVTLLAEEADPEELRAAGARWGVDGVWRTTESAAAAVLFGGPPLPWHVKFWAGDLAAVRDRTVLANHVRRIAGAFAVLPARRAFAHAARALVNEIRPLEGDTWRAKATRALRALANPFRRFSVHNRRGGGR